MFSCLSQYPFNTHASHKYVMKTHAFVTMFVNKLLVSYHIVLSCSLFETVVLLG